MVTEMARDLQILDEPLEIRKILVASANAVLRRKSLLVFLLVLALGAEALLLVADSTSAYTLFEVWGLGWLWTLGLLLTGILYFGAGNRLHRRIGEAQFFPWLATGTAALWVLVVGFWFLLTAAEWTTLQMTMSLLCLIPAALPLAIGYLGYSELWRELWHQETVKAVWRALPGGTLPEEADADERPESRFRKIAEGQKKAQEWGSQHCLDIVESTFEARVRHLPNSALHDIPDTVYDLCLDTGNDLFHYYRLRWPEAVLPPHELSSKTIELVRKLITIYLAGNKEQRWSHQQAFRLWRLELGASGDPYHRFLSFCFRLGYDAWAADILQEIEGALASYREMHNGRAEPGERTICQYTWLANAHRSLGAQPCYDAWLAMRRLEDQGPLPPPPSVDDDPSLRQARAFLEQHYASWAEATHVDWRQGFEGAALILQEEQRWQPT